MRAPTSFIRARVPLMGTPIRLVGARVLLVGVPVPFTGGSMALAPAAALFEDARVDVTCATAGEAGARKTP